MISSTKCNRCAAEVVCKYKASYEESVRTIGDAQVKSGMNAYVRARDCDLVRISISCPHMIVRPIPGEALEALQGDIQ